MGMNPDLQINNTATLMISCPDQRGINMAVASFVTANNGNILHLDQHVDQEQNVYFMRIEWELDTFCLPRDTIATAFKPLADEYNMDWQLHFGTEKVRMAIFVSKYSHCLYDLLARVQSGEWNVEVPLIISNHPDLKHVADNFGIPFHVLPVTKQNKAGQELKQHELLEENGVDVIVLARYMQIISDTLLENYPHRIINIHHSFLPAFVGAKPYHAAYTRGVKLVGATSHYVTAELDAGPIIEQDITRVTHKDTISDLIRKGRDLEKIVLSRAVYHHIRHRVLVYGNKTVILG